MSIPQGDILSPSDNKDAGSSKISASLKLLQDHLMSKRRSTQLSKAQQQKQKIASENTPRKKSENDWDPEGEYDPLMPNSYEVFQAEFLKAKELRLATLKAQASAGKSSGKLTNIPNLLDMVDRLDEDLSDGYATPSAKKARTGTAIAPPPSLSSAPSTSSSQTDTKDQVSMKPAKSVTFSSSSESGGSIAAKIMSRMGYKLGQGLGKDEQGISTPLEVEKSGLNAGRIVYPSQQQASNDEESDKKQQDANKTSDKMADLLRESTRVVLLQNMVGPGEVDEDLEAETKEECKKYGEVVKCIIFEIPNKRVPDDEAVRIFVEFKQVESAIRAASDLNGRYFGGRVVRASFYSVDKMSRYELGPG